MPIEDQNDEIDLLSFARLFWRGKWVILACMCLAVLIGGFYAFRVAVPMYPATSSIVLNDAQQQVITDIESIVSGGTVDSRGINTELEVLRSRNLVGQLVERLDLVALEEFNPTLRETGMREKLRLFILGLIGAGPDPSAPPHTQTEIFDSVVSHVRDTIEAENAANTLVISITVTTSDADLSVAMANALAEIYIENQIQVKLDALARATEFLSRRTAELRASLEGLENQLTAFSDQSDLLSAEVLDAQGLQLRTLRDRLTEAQARAEESAARLAHLRTLRAADNFELFVQEADEFRLNRAFAQFQGDLITQQALEADIDQFLLQLDAQVERDAGQLEALATSEASLAAQIDSQSGGADRQPVCRSDRNAAT